MGDSDHLWSACAALLRAQVSEPVWQTAFEGARPLGIADDRLTLVVPSAIAKERIEGRYLPLVRDALDEIGAGHLELALTVEPSDPGPLWTVSTPTLSASGAALSANGGDIHHASALAGAGSAASELLAGPTALEGGPRYTFDAFVIGASNRFAHAAALAVAEMPARKYNPLFIYGDAGLGKTHLLQAIAHYVDENYPTYRVRYVSSETFLNEFIDSMQRRTRDEFKRRYRDVDVLLVDDVQFFAGKEETVEEFFHTFNHLHQSNRQIVLSSDRPPDQIGIEDRLRSRFQQGLMTDIQPPELETRLAILRKKAERETAFIPNEILEFIGTHITDNIRVLEGALIRVSAFSNLTAEELTVERAAEVLADLLSDRQPRPITPQVILEATSLMFNFPIEEITGKNRRRPLVTARQISMYVFRELTDLSYPAIAREFGGRDHTTVMHAVEKISSLMSKQRQIYDQVTELVQTIRKG